MPIQLRTEHKHHKKPSNAQNQKASKQPVLNVQINLQKEKTSKPNVNSVALINEKSATQELADEKGKKKKKKNKKQLMLELTAEQEEEARTDQFFQDYITQNKIKHQTFNRDFNAELQNGVFECLKNQKKRVIDLVEPSIQENEHTKEKNSVLTQQIPQSMSHFNITRDVLRMVHEKKQYSQKRIYHAVLQQNRQYNELFWTHKIKSDPIKEQVETLFNGINCLMISDIQRVSTEGEEQKYDIRFKSSEIISKEDLMSGHLMKASEIRMAQGLIKDKLAGLYADFEMPEGLEASLNTQPMSRRFAPDSEETKKAEEFVRKMQEEQRAIRKRNSYIAHEQMLRQEAKLKEQQEIENHLKEERAVELRLKYRQTEEKREKLREARKNKEKEYQEYLSQYRQKKPLFQKNEEDFKRVMIQEHLRKLEAMKKVQYAKRQISREQIEQHDKKYQELKQLLEEEREEMLEMVERQNEQRKRTFYKGKFAKSILKESAQMRTLSEQKRSKAQSLYCRRSEYSTIIHKNFMPKIDLTKKYQLEQQIRDSIPREKDEKMAAEKIKIQGHRNLERLHKFVDELKAKGKVRQGKTSVANDNQKSNKNSERYTDYLSEIKSQRMASSRNRVGRLQSLNISAFGNNGNSIVNDTIQEQDSESNMNSSEVDRSVLSKSSRVESQLRKKNAPNDGNFQSEMYHMVNLQAKQLENEADRKSSFLKHAKASLDIDDYMAKKFQAEEGYLQSAKAKMQLIDQYRSRV